VVVADMPLLEVESSPAGSACCITCSRDTVAHGKGGVVFEAQKARHPAGFFVLGKISANC
jgi:hypothetical protein